jgi:hypothetical protein
MRPFEEGQEERINEAIRKRIRAYTDQMIDHGFNWAISPYTNETEHVVRIGTSILCTKWGIGYPGGSFVQAVVNNDLMEAFGRADSVNVNAIRFYVSLLYNQSYIE